MDEIYMDHGIGGNKALEGAQVRWRNFKLLVPD